MSAAFYAPPCPCRGAPFHDPLCPYFDPAHDPAGHPFAEGSPDRPGRWRDGDEDMRLAPDLVLAGLGIEDPPSDYEDS